MDGMGGMDCFFDSCEIMRSSSEKDVGAEDFQPLHLFLFRYLKVRANPLGRTRWGEPMFSPFALPPFALPPYFFPYLYPTINQTIGGIGPQSEHRRPHWK
jgi:hypothetical protein